jgi:hypothetical protein
MLLIKIVTFKVHGGVTTSRVIESPPGGERSPRGGAVQWRVAALSPRSRLRIALTDLSLDGGDGASLVIYGEILILKNI